MRKGDDGLYGLVKSQLEENPLSGRLFVFAQYLEEFLPRLGG
ncbi:MAG: Orf2 like protein [Chthoniobacteraceae bacterium]|nr:Orf2 like protein [Chthoniobacteraceae bacterium]